MKFVADLHIHSYLSRACSQNLRVESLYRWCQLKGIRVLSTGDFTHPQWIAELKEKLVPAEDGLYSLAPSLAKKVDSTVPESCHAPVRFLLGTEISSVYMKKGRVRKVHNLIFAPNFIVAEKINARLEKIGNLSSDGRPILGLDSKNLLSLIKEISENNFLIPAHAWTPHFSIFGSESGFDSLEECFEELTSQIFAIETGLSSDPPMNWRLSALDKITLISNSDAHSLDKLAREANLIDAPLSYQGIFDAFQKKNGARLLKTFEFFPEEGKYHLDGHRKCNRRMNPQETIQRNRICPTCLKPVTIGVLHRVEKLADRELGEKPEGAADFESIVPLKEILAQTLQVGFASKKVECTYFKLLSLFGNELTILRELALEKLESNGFFLLARALKRMREGKVQVQAGFDGEYGKITLLKKEDFVLAQQLSLL